MAIPTKGATAPIVYIVIRIRNLLSLCVWTPECTQQLIIFTY